MTDQPQPARQRLLVALLDADGNRLTDWALGTFQRTGPLSFALVDRVELSPVARPVWVAWAVIAVRGNPFEGEEPTLAMLGVTPPTDEPMVLAKVRMLSQRLHPDQSVAFDPLALSVDLT